MDPLKFLSGFSSFAASMLSADESAFSGVRETVHLSQMKTCRGGIKPRRDATNRGISLIRPPPLRRTLQQSYA